MNPKVSIIMGSTSDLKVMEKACEFLNDMEIPFEVNALSAHRTPDAVETFAKNAASRGIEVIIAAAGMAAALPGVVAASTSLPVIGVPIEYRSNASWHSCCNSRSEWFTQCSYPCSSNYLHF